MDLLVRLLLVSATAVPWLDDSPTDGEVLSLDANEPFAKQADFALGRRVLGDAATAWGERHDCVTCHTNGAFLLAGSWGAAQEDHARTRRFAADYVARFLDQSVTPVGRRGAVEGVVATTAMLTVAEARVGALTEGTRVALRGAFDRQDAEGAWPGWLQCEWPPYEVDEHYGASLMALAAGASRRDPVWKEPHLRRGLGRLRTWLRDHPPDGGHQLAMMLWASEELSDLATPGVRKRWRRELHALQREDGGWCVHDLRHAGWPNEPVRRESDAYATAFVCFVMLATGGDPADEQLAQALDWLRTHQRESGRWYVRSPRGGRHDYLSFSATAFAWMAFTEATKR